MENDLVLLFCLNLRKLKPKFGGDMSKSIGRKDKLDIQHLTSS